MDNEYPLCISNEKNTLCIHNKHLLMRIITMFWERSFYCTSVWKENLTLFYSSLVDPSTFVIKQIQKQLIAYMIARIFLN